METNTQSQPTSTGQPSPAATPGSTPSGQQTSTSTPAVSPPPATETDAVAQLRFNPLQVNEGPKVGPDAEGRSASVPSQAGPAAPSSQSNQPPDVNGQLAQINAILAQQGQQQQPQQQAQQQQQDPGAWAPNWDIPDPIIQAMMSGDPMQMKQGMAAIVNGLAKATYGQAMQAAQTMIAQAMSVIPQYLQTTMRARELHSKFYGANPDLNKEPLLPVIERIAMAESQRRQMLGMPVDVMSDDFHNAVANTARQILGVQQQAVSQQPQHPYFAGNGSRPAVAPRTEGILEQIGLA